MRFDGIGREGGQDICRSISVGFGASDMWPPSEGVEVV